MEIDITKLEKDLKDLNVLIEQYEEIYLNLYNEFQMGSLQWKDTHSVKFFENITDEKKEIALFIEEIKNVKDVYNYLIEKYKKIGNKIKCTIENEQGVISKLTLYIEKINGIIEGYNNLDLSHCEEVASYLQLEKTKWIKTRERLKNLSKRIKEIFEHIKETEEKVNLEITKINIRKIQETEVIEILR